MLRLSKAISTKWKLALGGLALLIVVVVVAWLRFLSTPLIPSGKTLAYSLKPGANIKTLTTDLHNYNILPCPKCLIALAYFKGVTKHLQAGEYLFVAGTTPGQLLDNIAQGLVFYHRFTLIEGWTFQQLISAINSDPHIVHTFVGLPLTSVIAKLNLPPGNPEGLFWPATYRFAPGTTDVVLLQTAYHAMNQQLNQAWQQRAAGLPYKTAYEALIAASIVERETRLANQRPLVAGVIVRRLQKNMPLQMDSTIVYNVKQQGLPLNKLAYQQDGPYNTYRHLGLPIAPIAMPGKDSLLATLHPDTGSALYFVETGTGDGSLRFSDNFVSHSQEVVTYQLNKHILTSNKDKPVCPESWYLSAALRELLHC